MELEEAKLLAAMWSEEPEDDNEAKNAAVVLGVELESLDNALVAAESHIRRAEDRAEDQAGESETLLQLVAQFRRLADGTWEAEMFPGFIGCGPTRVDALTMAYSLAHRALEGVCSLNSADREK